MRPTTEGDGPASGGTSIDELLDHAVAAINRGDRETATTLVGHVQAADAANTEAEDLLAAPLIRVRSGG
jgi:alkyl sulfatase BDS1-like metallo-beta-lactamase superfamily hydrolase